MIDVDINESNAAFLAKFRVPAPPIPPKAGRPTAADIVSSSSLKSGKISPPKNPPMRHVDFMPYEAATLSSDIKRVNDPYEHKLRNALFFLILSVGFLSSFLLGVHPEVCLLLSLIFFSIASYAFATHFHKMHKKGKKDDSKKQAKKDIPSKRALDMRPSEKFIKRASLTPFDIDVSKVPDSGNGLNLYRQFVNADRPNASFKKTQLKVAKEASIDQLANETLAKLNLKSSTFNQYLVNMKAFLSKNLISKLALELHSDSAAVEMMLSVPTFEHCRNYVIQRIRALAASHYLAGHFGDKGEKYGEREWSKELPSDNQIILHILSVWLSYMMTHMKPDSQRPPLVFSQKFIAIGKEPEIQTENDIYLCTDDFNKFYVLTKSKNTEKDVISLPERYFAFPGKDSMYSGLTLFFYFVKEKYQFLLDGADLQEPPHCMNRIFESARLT